MKEGADERGLAGALPRRGPFLVATGGLVALAWLALLIWQRSPYGRYLDHGQWTEIGLAANLCRYLPAGPIVLPALLYAGGWLLMTIAMMLPTALPLIDIFARLTARRFDRGALISLLIIGYLSVWGIFGVTAHVLDAVLHAIIVANAWLTFNGWIIGALVLALAGAFQFSALKYRCLDKCRTPLSFVMQHWRGQSERGHAFLLGVHHGIFCVGCCWAIMLLMFVVGTGSVGWMLALGAVMAVEKNSPWGRALGVPLGFALLLLSSIVVVMNILASTAT